MGSQSILSFNAHGENEAEREFNELPKATKEVRSQILGLLTSASSTITFIATLCYLIEFLKSRIRKTMPSCRLLYLKE